MKAVYLTFNDSPSGVYSSQIIDAVNFMNERQVAQVRLVAFVSIRNYRKDQLKILRLCPEAIVIPMFPGVKNWKVNLIPLFILLLFLRPKTIMARGIFATYLANRCRKLFPRLVFDARGAYFAEFKEHQLIDDARFVQQVKQLEFQALKNSDAQLAVSHALTKYWKNEYAFEAENTAQIIPCTLAEMHRSTVISDEERNKTRMLNDVKNEECVLVYSGSAAGWQSLEDLFNWLARVMEANSNVRLLLLTPLNSIVGTPLSSFADRVMLRWVSPSKVAPLLAMADYGLLLRKPDITNSVASPTKFAEYLASGLQVLISPGIGDFTDFTIEHKCGQVIQGPAIPPLRPLASVDRAHSRKLADHFFRKQQYLSQYTTLMYRSIRARKDC